MGSQLYQLYSSRTSWALFLQDPLLFSDPGLTRFRSNAAEQFRHVKVVCFLASVFHYTAGHQKKKKRTMWSAKIGNVCLGVAIG